MGEMADFENSGFMSNPAETTTSDEDRIEELYYSVIHANRQFNIINKILILTKELLNDDIKENSMTAMELINVAINSCRQVDN